MLPASPTRLRLLALASAIVAVFVGGCASWQGPRIDPSGNHILVWPNQPQTYVSPVAGAAPLTPATTTAPPPGAFVVPQTSSAPVATAPMPQPLTSVAPSTPFGNVVAPPVFSDPAQPPVAAAPLVASVPPAVAPSLPPPTPTAAPTLPTPPVVIPTAGAVPTVAVPPGCDYLQSLPSVLIAPVGREMLLKGRIVTPEGTLLAARRIDWTVCSGVGAFTEMGFRDQAQIASFWEVPQKIDDRLATSATALVPITLNTSTPDPNDDIPILRGESWVTLTSACEGSTVVAAHAPSLDAYNIATTTIHWIDAQWVFNQTVPAEAGRPYTLTTTVMRRTDGAPLAGWIVRYDVAAGAALGYGGGSSVESTTDAAGRASVEVSPRNAAPGVTNVGITIIRPATGGAVPMPRLEVGRAASAITWGAATAPTSPAPALPSGAIAPSAPLSLPPPPVSGAQPSPPRTTPPTASPPPSPYTPPSALPPAAATGTPRLELKMGEATPPQVAVGGFVSFDVTVTNRGDGIARGIKISDRFDRGLRHPSAQPGVYSVDYTGMKDLAPNESASLPNPLTFQVVDSGVQCHELTVTADGAAPVTERRCVTSQRATLEINVAGPRRHTVGETAKFRATIRNTGDVAATNVEIVAKSDPILAATSAEQGAELLTDGSVRLKIDSLAPTETRTFGLESLCKAARAKACMTFQASADGGVTAYNESCFEIIEAVSGLAPGGSAPATAGLQCTVTTNAAPARVGQKFLLTVTVSNTGQQVERQVAMRVLLTPELVLDATQIQPAGEATVTAQDVRFVAIPELPAGQQKQYVLPFTPSRTGRVQITAQVAAASLATPMTVTSDPIEIAAAP